MNVLLFGATGMVGQGVLREALADPGVERVLSVGRSPVGRDHPRLSERLVPELTRLAPPDAELSGFGACFFCAGVSSVGMDEAEYRHLTLELTLAAADVVARANPGITFCYVSGEGTDSSEAGRIMWARVKGRTENALLAHPGLDAWMFRPGFIQPLHGVRSKVRLYHAVYTVVAPFHPLIRRIAPTHVTTSVNLGKAMLAVAQGGYESRILENTDINRLAERHP